MKHFFCVFSFGCFFSVNAEAASWYVGPSQTYTAPSQVSPLVQNGDTVNIEAGLYPSDVAHWTANNLVLRGVGGYAQLASGGLVYGGKAIWVISGNNTKVEYIDFSQAACPDLNGAGIRQEGQNLVVRHCKFHDNEEGILAGTVNPSNILVEYSEFNHNGAGDGYSHNLYINHIDTFMFRYNYSHDAVVGHELKTRANVNIILYNRITDEANGTASYNIDLPNGGTAYVIGNVIEQGPQTQNSTVISYGVEGLTNPSPNQLYFINNTVVNDHAGGSFFNATASTALLKAYNNIFAGPGAFLNGASPINLDTASNRFSTDTASFRFADATHYNYRLTDSSTSVVNHGANPGLANGVALTPTFQYAHPADASPRCTSGLLDIGAYELCEFANDVIETPRRLMLHPNPTAGIIHFDCQQQSIVVTNVLGKVVYEGRNVSSMDMSQLPDGLYYLRLNAGVQSVLVQRPR